MTDGTRVTGVDVRGERILPATRHLRRALVRHADAVRRPGAADAGPARRGRGARWTSKPIVTVNLWYDRRVMDEPFVGLPGRSMQWVFDKRLAFGSETSHLSLVASGADALARRAHRRR